MLPWLLAGHLIGDWIVQTDWQATNKTRSWAAMAAHMASYHLMLALALLGWAGGVHAHIAARGVVLAVSLVTHAFIDRRWPVRWLLSHTGSAAFADTTWGIFVADQALHLSILSILAGSLS